MNKAHQEPKEEDTQLLREVFGNLGVYQMEQKQEISALGFNESQFNCIGEDSQYNDVIEISAFAKPSMIGRFLDKDGTPENELVKRARLISDIDIPFNRKSSIVEKNKDENQEPANFEEPQYFLDLDTSGIAGDALHHIDREFGDGDGSFIGFREHNSHEAEDANEFFDPKPSPGLPNEDNIPITPQIKLGVG